MSANAFDQLYPILPWDALHGWDGKRQRKHGLESIAACNFTVAGFVRPEDLPMCEQLGLAAILLCEPLQGAQFKWAEQSDAQIEAIVKGWLAQAGDSPALYGFFVYDEPGANDFAGLARIVAAIKRLAPGKIAYLNLFPNYATMGGDESQLQTATYEEHLERFVAEVQPPFLSYDNYMVQYGQDLRDKDKTALYYTNLLQMREVAQRHDLPWWHIVGSNRIFDYSWPPSPASLLFQAYTTLAAGAGSLGWFTYYGSEEYGRSSAIDAAENKTVTWYYLSEVNRQVKVLGPQLMRLRSTGVFFSAPAPASGLPVLPGRCVAAVQCETPIMAGEFSGADGADYVMLVNLSVERSGRCAFQLKDTVAMVTACSVEDGEYRPLEEDRVVWLVPGQGVLLRLTHPGA